MCPSATMESGQCPRIKELPQKIREAKKSGKLCQKYFQLIVSTSNIKKMIVISDFDGKLHRIILEDSLLHCSVDFDALTWKVLPCSNFISFWNYSPDWSKLIFLIVRNIIRLSSFLGCVFCCFNLLLKLSLEIVFLLRNKLCDLLSIDLFPIY